MSLADYLFLQQLKVEPKKPKDWAESVEWDRPKVVESDIKLSTVNTTQIMNMVIPRNKVWKVLAASISNFSRDVGDAYIAVHDWLGTPLSVNLVAGLMRPWVHFTNPVCTLCWAGTVYCLGSLDGGISGVSVADVIGFAALVQEANL